MINMNNQKLKTICFLMLLLTIQSLSKTLKKSKIIKTKENTDKAETENKMKLKNHSTCSHGLKVKNRLGYNFYSHPKKTHQISYMKGLPNYQWVPMKVYLDFYDLDLKFSEGKLTDFQYNNIKEALNNAKKIFEKLLKVQRLYERIYPGIDDVCMWNPKIKKNGVKADIAFCVTIMESSRIVASASFLELLKENNRPVTGEIFWNPEFVYGNQNEVLSMTSTALHELTHALVFDSDLYPKYVDKRFIEIPIEKIIKTNKNNRKMIITPKVVQAAKKHFNCDLLEGLEVEDDGGSGTITSHWEERLMRSDYMCGMVTNDSTISEMTLALFEDSGWYKSKKYTGGLFNFGKNAGCDILNEKCIDNKKTKYLNEFCLKEYERGCSANRRYKSTCMMTTQNIEDIAEEDIYFDVYESDGDEVVETGIRPLADNCPLPVEWYSATNNLAGSCSFGEKRKDWNSISSYEMIQADSACFLTNVMSKEIREEYTFSWEEFSPFTHGCYQYKCDHTNKLINLVLNEKIYDCPSRGGIIEIEEDMYAGSIICPDYYLICNQTVLCTDMIDCVNKKSLRIENNEPLNNEFNIAVGSNLNSESLAKKISVKAKN